MSSTHLTSSITSSPYVSSVQRLGKGRATPRASQVPAASPQASDTSGVQKRKSAAMARERWSALVRSPTVKAPSPHGAECATNVREVVAEVWESHTNSTPMANLDAVASSKQTAPRRKSGHSQGSKTKVLGNKENEAVQHTPPTTAMLTATSLLNTMDVLCDETLDQVPEQNAKESTTSTPLREVTASSVARVTAPDMLTIFQGIAGHVDPALPFRHGKWTLSTRAVVPLAAEAVDMTALGIARQKHRLEAMRSSKPSRKRPKVSKAQPGKGPTEGCRMTLRQAKTVHITLRGVSASATLLKPHPRPLNVRDPLPAKPCDEEIQANEVDDRIVNLSALDALKEASSAGLTLMPTPVRSNPTGEETGGDITRATEPSPTGHGHSLPLDMDAFPELRAVMTSGPLPWATAEEDEENEQPEIEPCSQLSEANEPQLADPKHFSELILPAHFFDDGASTYGDRGDATDDPTTRCAYAPMQTAPTEAHEMGSSHLRISELFGASPPHGISKIPALKAAPNADGELLNVVWGGTRIPTAR